MNATRDEAIIYAGDGKDHWESFLISGALSFHAVRSRVLPFGSFSDAHQCALPVILPTDEEIDETIPSIKKKIRGPFILAGRAVTARYVQKSLPIEENEILIYGEPYAAVPRLFINRGLIDKIKGKAICGSLLDLSEYRIPITAQWKRMPIPILTSLGCVKKCGYCSYGATHSHIYTNGFRRERPWRDIIAEINGFMSQGITSFRLLADQFLSSDPGENFELESFVRNWDPENMGRPLLSFTVSPAEVLRNKEILLTMAQVFNLHPRLSIESFDNSTLAFLDLDFNCAAALDALSFFTKQRLPLRLNYILIRPGMTMERLKQELGCFRSLADSMSHLTTAEQILIAHDLFSGFLRIRRGSPITAKGDVRDGYENELNPRLLKLITRIYEAIQKETENLLDGHPGKDPLSNIIEVGLKMCP